MEGIREKTFDVTKNVTEKSVDSFQEWKDDPKRIAKVEKKKATKKARKEIEKAEKESQKRKTLITLIQKRQIQLF